MLTGAKARSEGMKSVDKYTNIAVLLHWLIALLIFCNIVLGLGSNYLPDAYVRPVIDLHKSIGITVLGLAFLRFFWRFNHPPPPFPAEYRQWETALAHIAHVLLYVLIFAIPITGWIHDSAWDQAATHPMQLFWIIPWFRLGFITSLDPAAKEMIHSQFGQIHEWLGYALYVVLALHISGALKHQLIDKHRELQRMLP
jgi:cytochrome b561